LADKVECCKDAIATFLPKNLEKSATRRFGIRCFCSNFLFFEVRNLS
jgi:hypothetical protein